MIRHGLEVKVVVSDTAAATDDDVVLVSSNREAVLFIGEVRWSHFPLRCFSGHIT